MTLTDTLFAPPAPPGRDGRPDPTRRLAYQPALDGFRGLAVLAVVLYHGGLSWATGGYLGVDAFFVLSGYLITSLLLAEWDATRTIALVQFWSRRARRLLPALFVFLVGMAAYNLWVASPDVLTQLRADALSTLFYVMNWRLVASAQSYFDPFFASPFRHMWSLAIEEQYYLVWPLVVLGVLRWRRRPQALLKVCLALAAGSALLMALLYRADVDPSRLYYGTDTRAQSLLVGSALAAAVASGLRFDRVWAARAVLIGAVVAVVFLAVNWVRLPASDPLLYRGGFLVFALSVALIIAACTQIGPNVVRTGLSFEPLRRLGLISYGVYLYHWPIYSWLNAERTGLAATSLRLLALRLAVTLAVALASYLLLEKPIREGALNRLHVSNAVQALLLPVSAALVLLLILTSTAGAARTIATPADFDPANRPPPTVSAAGGGAPGATGDSKVLLVGDSVAYTMGVGFEGSVAPDGSSADISAANHLVVWNQAVLFCELIEGAHRENGEVVKASDTCRTWEADWRNAVDIFKPDATVLQVGAWEIFDREINGNWVEFGTPEYDAILKPALQKAVDALSSGGAPVIVLTTPRFTRDDGTSAKEWTQNDAARTDHFNALLRDLAAANPGTVHLVDFGSYLCPDNQCRTEIDGVRMRTDGVHFKEDDARVAAAWLAPQFRAIAQAARAPAPAAPATSAPAGSTPPSTPATEPVTSAPDPAG